MKTHLHPIRGLAQACLVLAAAASVSAQTVITPDLKAPPSAYSTSSIGMVLRAHQIYAARTPGDQNSLANINKQLSGGFGANQATSGPLTGGLWSEVYLNHTHFPGFPALGDGDWFPFTAPALPFPGVNVDTNFTLGFTTIAYEIITYLDLPAGTNTLGVGCGDAYKIYIGAGDNPYSLAAASPAQFNGSRGFAPSIFEIDVQSAGVYPVRFVFGQAGDQVGGLQFYSMAGGFTNLINDPSPSGGVVLTAYQPAVLPIPAPSLAYVTLLAPAPGETGLSPKPTVRVELVNGTTTTVNTNLITLSFDTVAVTPTITQTGNVTYVSYVVPSLLATQSVHSVQFSAQDTAANVISNNWSFTVGSFTIVPPAWAYPNASGDATQPGFAGKIHQVRAGANLAASLATAESQLAGTAMDEALPFINTIVTNSNPIVGGGWGGTTPANDGGAMNEARTFISTSNINYSIADGFGSVANIGNFTTGNGYPDSLFPGMPGADDGNFTTYNNPGEHAVEVLGWIQLPAGEQRIGVTCPHSFELAISPNDARDLFRTSLAKFDGQRDASTSTTVTLFVETNGVYSFRLVFRTYRANVPTELEWYRYDATGANPVLINDTVIGAVKSFRTVTVPTRPYVKSVSPANNASGVVGTTAVSVVLVNKGNDTPVLKVGGSTVAYTMITNGNEVTLTYIPTTPLKGTVNCEVNYGGLVGTWSYRTPTGQRALFVVPNATPNASETFLANRLVQKFGLDVDFFSSGSMAANASTLSVASNRALILISSTIPGASMEAWARAFTTNNPLYATVPVINWEGANADEWGFSVNGGSGSGSANIAIVNATNGLTAGLTNGTHVVYTAVGNDGQRVGGTPITGLPTTSIIVAANNFDAVPIPRIVGLEQGLVIDNYAYVPGGTLVTNQSRKVFLGLLGNNNAENLNTNGLAVLDAAITWAVSPVLSAEALPGGQMNIFWSSAGTLQTATNLAAPAWITAPSQANPQVVPATGPQRYYRVKKDW